MHAGAEASVKRSVLVLMSLWLVLGVAGAEVERPPVVIVPGAPGTELVDRETGKLAWPRPFRMMIQAGSDYLALPLEEPESTPQTAGRLLRGIRVMGINFPLRLYDGLEQFLVERGYREGNWDAPRGEGEYFYYTYDWRQSVESNGRALARRLESFSRATRDRSSKVTLIGHSLGGLVARYALMFGDRGLGTEGALPAPEWSGTAWVDRLFLVATPNDGSFMSLRYLETGNYHLFDRGGFSPKVLFSFPSMFDLIPLEIEPLIDRDGKPTPFSLNDPEDWERLGWSVFDKRYRTPESLPRYRAHLRRELARRERLHRALRQAEASESPIEIVMIAGEGHPVQRTAMLVGPPERFRVRCNPPSQLKKKWRGLLFEPGDSLVPTRSVSANGRLGGRALTTALSHQRMISSAELLQALEPLAIADQVQQPALGR
jgi:pimeloyl-ACP methyl ester carboxylesterase